MELTTHNSRWRFVQLIIVSYYFWPTKTYKETRQTDTSNKWPSLPFGFEWTNDLTRCRGYGWCLVGSLRRTNCWSHKIERPDCQISYYKSILETGKSNWPSRLEEECQTTTHFSLLCAYVWRGRNLLDHIHRQRVYVCVCAQALIYEKNCNQ